MGMQYSDFGGISRKAPPLRPKHDPGTPQVRPASHMGQLNQNRLPSMGGNRIQGAGIDMANRPRRIRRGR